MWKSQIIVDHHEMFMKVDGWNDVKLNEILFMEVKSLAILCHLEQKPNVKELPKRDLKMTLGTKIITR